MITWTSPEWWAHHSAGQDAGYVTVGLPPETRDTALPLAGAGRRRREDARRGGLFRWAGTTWPAVAGEDIPAR